jgi:sugar (pentulose or hexulose) kinase
MTKVIAVDLGASQGRVMVAAYGGDGFSLEEAHRFPNVPVKRGRFLCWNVKRLWQEVVKGIEWARSSASSVGIDTWGVDYGLLDKKGNILGDPVHYRDPRTRGLMEWVFERMPRREIFERTGVQFLELNTLYQLASLVKTRSRLLRREEPAAEEGRHVLGYSRPLQLLVHGGEEGRVHPRDDDPDVQPE